MGVQRSNRLEDRYRDAAEEARTVVAARYRLGLCRPDSLDYPGTSSIWREVWRVDLDGAFPLQVLIGIPSTFPDELPTAYLPQETAAAAAPFPHLNRNRILCTFDSTTSFPNADQPSNIALAVIERATEIWNAGAAETNRADFADELKAYWDDVATINAFSIVPPLPLATPVAVLELSPAWAGSAWFFAETALAARMWLDGVGYAGKIRDRAALYLPVASLGLPPFPSTNGDLYGRLEASGPEALRHLLSFLGRFPRPTAVLAGVPAGNGAGIATLAWSHPELTRTVAGKNGFYRASDAVPGFRPGHLPPALELSSISPHGILIRADVTDVSQERLALRTAGSAAATFPHPVNVIGCGSVGGFLAEGIARSGYAASLRLVDTDLLGAENVQRHYCGMSDVGQLKTKVLRRKLRQHFPHLRCSTYERNVLDVMSANPTALSPASLTIIALGNTAVERRLNRLLFDDGMLLECPVVFVWVEPFLTGGHAVKILSPEPGCFECLFDGRLRFRHRIIREPQQFARREAGCQSSYTPYGGNAVAEFAASVLRFCLRPDPHPSNTLFTWCGDLDAARAADIDIRREYEGVQSFSSVCRSIVARVSCPVCSP